MPRYLPGYNPFCKQVQIRVAPHEEVGSRLLALGIDPARDIDAVILSHFHHDHTGGLDHFPHSGIIGPRANHAVSTGRRGCLPQRWPIWLRLGLIDMDGPPVGPFAASHYITRDGRIVMVPTPGQVAGHASVIVRGEKVAWLLAGDATYSQANLIAERTNGVRQDRETALATLRAIRRFTVGEPTVLLPAHDPEASARLASGAILT